jgi:hypothetical protein
MDEMLSIVNVNGSAIEIARTDPSPGRIPKIKPNKVPIRIARSGFQLSTGATISKIAST